MHRNGDTTIHSLLNKIFFYMDAHKLYDQALHISVNIVALTSGTCSGGSLCRWFLWFQQTPPFKFSSVARLTSYIIAELTILS